MTKKPWLASLAELYNSMVGICICREKNGLWDWAETHQIIN